MSSPAPFEVIRGASGVVVVAFPPSWAALELDETDNDAATAETFETGRQVMARLSRVVALVDGPMFEIVGGGTDYARAGAKARLLYRYLDRRHGIDRPTRYPERGATIAVTPDGVASIQSGAREAPGAVFAVQGYPELVRAGRVVIGTRDADTTGRAAFVLLRDGRLGFAVGRASMHEFASVLAGLPVGVSDAVYTDGGGSTTLALRGEGGALAVAQGLDSRKLPVYITAEPPPMGVGMAGGGSGGAAAGGLLARFKPGPALRFLLGVATGTAILAGGVYYFRDRAPVEPVEL